MSRWRRFFSRWQNWIGLLLILAYLGAAIFAPLLSPDDPDRPGPFKQVGRVFIGEPQPPEDKALLGMLPFGIDVYHALIWGSRDALLFGLIVTFSTALVGVLYGAISGFAGNRLGGPMLRVADAFLAFPPIAGLVFLQQLYVTSIDALGGYFSTTGEIYTFSQTPLQATLIQRLLERVDPLMLSLIVFSWMPYARLVHSIVMTLKQTEFVQAAHALGGGPFWIIRKHLLPNSIGPAIVLGARDIGGVVLLQATLTFVQIGGGSIWGEMLAQGRNWVIGPGGNLLRYWWVFLPPTFAIMLFGIAWNMFGDSLNDVLDPTFQRSLPGRSFWRRGKKDAKAKAAPAPHEERLPAPRPASAPVEAALSRERELLQAAVEEPSSPNGADPILRMARDSLSRGDLTQALYAYHHLIARSRSVDEILPDLARLAKSYPRDARVWQTLGDALTRAGHLDHAAQSYEQAQKLDGKIN
jgi:ABC-type dipeptide/oligopeptide/nickel transport system permease subunit